MTSFLVSLDGLDRRIAETSTLPSAEQPEALIALFQACPHADLAPFVALLIGEVVARRPHRPSPQPSPAAPSA